MKKRAPCFIATALVATLGVIAAFAQTANTSGINIGINPAKLSPPESMSFDQFEQDDKRRIALAEADGFTLVRLRFHLININDAADDARRESTLRAMSDFVADANERGMKTLVALQYENGRDAQKLVCDDQENFMHMVLMVTRRLPDSSLAGIEPLNEPPDGCGDPTSIKRWVNLQQRLYQQVRHIRPHLTFVANGGGWGTLDGLLKLDPAPYRADENVLFSLHYYEPFLFTGQGQSGLYPGSTINVPHFPWPYDAAAVQQAETLALQKLSSDPKLAGGTPDATRKGLMAEYDKYAQTGQAGYARSRFALVGNWARKYGIAPERVYVGELGVIRPNRTPAGPVEADAAKWIAATVKAARQNGFLWAIFELDSAYSILCGNPPNQKMCDEYREALERAR